MTTAAPLLSSQHSPNQNHLLAVLPTAEFERLLPHLELVPMRLGEVLCESSKILQHGYFANHNKRLEQAVLERTAELRESEERLHRLTERSSDWYWEQDAGGEFTRVSGPALEANIAARLPFLDFIYSRINTDGSKQFFQVSGEPIFDSSGGYTGYRGIGMDVTGRMQSALG